MKFSKILSIVLATLAVGLRAHPTTPFNDIQHVPQDISSGTLDSASDIERRANHDETDRFKKTQKGLGKQKLQLGKSYSFKVTWTSGAAGSTTKTTYPIQREMKKTQQEYGFDHTAIVVGEVVKIKQGEVFKLDFKGRMYHLRADLEGSGQRAWYRTSVEGVEWEPKDPKDSKGSPKTMKYLHLKEVDGKWSEKAAHANTAATKVSDNNGNKWQGKRNDCEEYVKAFEKAL
ncbi:hypothetical protein BDV32DRAFT_152224 [Aspergillus pseudonomiae]|uniref:Uncharacterized protein n=1 Tax=Aspergillus pseudonomiae TaxID=1506151 RepID=A0A5N6HT93_9EURO|nr:uncharacterized protein BDV37DRAFT_284224 [Aspergillus pseudonomiae]KAB8257636.1 hypothetical protein BDV32DRAFT_152224 [Aspergillus pseudonomiae]KAE8402898.1 hypothetical protein BDV37DRAFT_284224 [Aspergillus pseudonomiae]